MSSSRTDPLVLALRVGHARQAARLAGERARAGAWDEVVAATLVVHGRPGSAERQAAEDELVVRLQAGALARDPDAPARWGELLAALVDRGRLADACRGLAHATAAGLLGPAAWLALALHLCARGERAAALALVEAAARRFPDAEEVWSAAALLLFAASRHADAADAAARAPRLPGAALVTARLAALRGDHAAAGEAKARGRRLGAPAWLVA